jgi:hypothetical protein
MSFEGIYRRKTGDKSQELKGVMSAASSKQAIPILIQLTAPLNPSRHNPTQNKNGDRQRMARAPFLCLLLCRETSNGNHPNRNDPPAE